MTLYFILVRLFWCVFGVLLLVGFACFCGSGSLFRFVLICLVF